MPTFVDFAGMNTLILSTGSFDENNVIESQVNPEFSLTNSEDELVGINLHRNGPYGYSSWKQLRASENPITRYNRKKNIFTLVKQPGIVRNISNNGEFRVRDRYSAVYRFKEPVVAQKTKPLVWNVGRHVKDSEENISLQKFSVISSYANSKIYFANEEANSLLQIKKKNSSTEYSEISKMYLSNGLNSQESPLTYWEFMQYRETIYPKYSNQFDNDIRTRPEFESFYNSTRINRTREKYLEPESLGFIPSHPQGLISPRTYLRQSTWPLDEHEDFLNRSFGSLSSSIDWNNNDYSLARYVGTYPSDDIGSEGRFGEGILMNSYTQFWSELPNKVPLSSNLFDINRVMGPGPLYSRRSSIDTTGSVVSPTGMIIPETSSASNVKNFQGGAVWEAGDKRWIRDENGNYVSSSKTPFPNTYGEHSEDIRAIGKEFSILPEFRISTQIEDILKSSGGILEDDIFEVVGGVSGSKDSSKQNFYNIYSTTDFLKQFDVLEKDHLDFADEKVLSLRCRVIKKLTPYEGFYPCQITADLATQFYNSYGDKIDLSTVTSNTSSANFAKQFLMTPLFAPGVLFNTIKSGVAVDYPIVFSGLRTTGSVFGQYLIREDFDRRVPFEALVEPEKYLANILVANNEPHPSGNMSASVIWNGDGDQIFKMKSNNFLAEVPEFFLPGGSFTSIVSKKQGQGILLQSGSHYGMRLKMYRSMNQAKNPVFNKGSEEDKYFVPQDIAKNGLRETFTMYSRPSAFGPESYGLSFIYHDSSSVQDSPFYQFETDDVSLAATASNFAVFGMNSANGYSFPFTPPYYHGESWCDIIITGSGELLTIKQIQDQASYDFKRFDIKPLSSYGTIIDYSGPQSFGNINKNAVQLSSSVNIDGIGKVSSKDIGGTAGSFRTAIVDSALDEDARWVIQTKFETPMLNFNHVSTDNDTLSLPSYSPGNVPRGMWHQYGLIPEESEGVFMAVEPIPDAYQLYSMERPTADIKDLSKELGFSGVATKLGRLANGKIISEAVVAIPFVEKDSKRQFFKIDKEKVEMFKNGSIEEITSGSPSSQIGRSVLLQLQKMKKFVLPPSFDFLNYDNVEPIAMYIFDFSHKLSQQDLSDIWQNLPPEISSTPEVEEIAITHPLLKKELLGSGGASGNESEPFPTELKWLVFKAKQRAASSYFKKTVKRNEELNSNPNSSNASVDEFGSTNPVHFNWPYDYFSLIELAKIDAEVEFGNTDFSNYVSEIPSWQGKSADLDKVSYIVSGISDKIVVDSQAGSSTSFDADSVSDSLSIGTSSGTGSQLINITQTSGPVSLPQMQASSGKTADQSVIDRELARRWMNILGAKANDILTQYGTRGLKSNARRLAIASALSDNQLNEWMARIGMADGVGNFDSQFRWEMKVSSDYGGIPIPYAMSQLTE
jgi:hypothetical protein